MMEMNMTVTWLVLLIVLVVIELLTMGLTTIWFAVGALVAAILAAFGAPFSVQIIVCGIIATILLIFTRPVAVKYFNRDRIRTNVESLVGKQAIVISEINNLQGVGQVNVGGQEWSARAMDEQKCFPVGTVVKVVAISGVKLIVEEKE